jgi:type IV pilus assembly protein PilB
MAQRLVRKLCPVCKKELPITEVAKKEIDRTLDEIVDKSQIPATSIGAAAKMWGPVGCDKCNNTGYKGRVGIYEAILMNQTVEKVVQSNASDREIWVAARDQGLLTMKQDGILKVLNGTTSLDELQRVIAIAD